VTDVLAVINPCTLRDPCAARWRAVLAHLGLRVAPLETRGDGADCERIAAAIGTGRPPIVIAGGGDGTVRCVAAAVLAVDAAIRPALAIAPLGTANNVARSLGLTPLRRAGGDAVEGLVAAIRGARRRRIDVGTVGGAFFIGSFAAGMDAAILRDRNRWCRRWPLRRDLAGYPLYLLSCAVNLARKRSARGRVVADGDVTTGPIYDLLVANTAIYAGEFRFDAEDRSDDGRLDLHLFATATDYVRGFVAAWRRHVQHARGRPVTPPARLRRITAVEVAFDRPIPSQIDGEELTVADRFAIRVQPGALRVCVP
jgi:diacylglycerol kinase (ATP)